MDAMQFLRGVDNPMQPYALPHLGLVPNYQQRLQALYPGQSIAQLEQNAYDANRAEFDRLLALGRPDVLQGWIRSRLQGTMYEDIEELAFAVGRSVDELQYYLSVDPLELLRQAEAQQEAARLAEIAANAERIRLQQIEEQRAAEARVRQWELEAQQLVAETAAREAAQTAQRIAQAEKQLRDELRAQWPAGDIDAQVTIYNQLLTQPPRSHAEVESILSDVLGEGAELQTLLRYTRNAQQGISLAETAAQIAREEAEAPIRAFQAATQAELQKTLQYIAESGSVPVEEMIATGAYTQAQIDLAAQVQARQLAAQQEATRLDLERQEAERRAKVLAEIAQAQAEEQAAIQAYIAQQQAERKAELIQSGEMPLQQMIATGLFTSDEIAQAAQVQQAQEAARLAEIAANAERIRLQQIEEQRAAEEQAAIQAYIAQQQAAKGTDMERYVFADFTLPQGWYQLTGAQKAAWFNQNNVSPAQLKTAGVPDEDIAALRQEGYIVQDVVSDTSQSAFNAQMQALQDNVIEIWSARADGRSYALPVWSIQYPLIPADVVENWLASFGLPTIAELEAELAASQAAASGVDQSRGIDATIVVTAPAAPSDTVSTAPDKYDFSNWVGNQVSSGNTRQDAKTLYQTFIDMFTSGQNLPVKNLQEVLLNLRMGDLSAAVILSKFVYDNLTNAEVRSEFIKAYSGYGASVDELNVYVDYFLNYIGPDVTTPVVTTPVVTTPVVTTPVVTTPVVTTPVVTTPVVTTPVVTTPVVTAPAVVTPAVVTPLIVLPDDWDTYSESRKIAWFNANQIKPSQLIAAGVPASDIAYMRANGYTVKEQAPAAGGGAALLLALASAYFLGA